MLAQRSRDRCEGTAMGAITLDLRPGSSLGPFRLGMPICEAFGHVEQHQSIYDVVHVKYHDEEPLMFDLVISFPDHGFHHIIAILNLSTASQMCIRLRLIEVFDVQRLLIGGPNTLATFVAVYALFGPTFPGIYDEDRGIYTLLYPGLSFAFPIPVQYTECCKNREAELPLEFPNGTTPVTSRVCIYDSSVGGGVGVGVALKKAIPPQLPTGSPRWWSDVWAELGRPCSIQQKQAFSLLLAMILRAMVAPRKPDYDSDEDYIPPRGNSRQPLLSHQGSQAPSASVMGENRSNRADVWSKRMREKYGLNTNEFTYDSSDPKTSASTTTPTDDTERRCAIM